MVAAADTEQVGRAQLLLIWETIVLRADITADTRAFRANATTMHYIVGPGS